jgi:hypothetical protein
VVDRVSCGSSSTLRLGPVVGVGRRGVASARDGWRLGLALCRGSFGERIVYTYRCSFYLRLLCTSALRRGLDVCECFCFLPSSFSIGCVGGEQDLVVAGCDGAW